MLLFRAARWNAGAPLPPFSLSPFLSFTRPRYPAPGNEQAEECKHPRHQQRVVDQFGMPGEHDHRQHADTRGDIERWVEGGGALCFLPLDDQLSSAAGRRIPNTRPKM